MSRFDYLIEGHDEMLLAMCRNLSEVLAKREWRHRAAQDGITAAVYLAQDYANGVLDPADIEPTRKDLQECDLKLGAAYTVAINSDRRAYLIDDGNLEEAQALIDLIDARVRDGIKADQDISRVLFPRRYAPPLKLPAPNRAGPPLN